MIIATFIEDRELLSRIKNICKNNHFKFKAYKTVKDFTDLFLNFDTLERYSELKKSAHQVIIISSDFMNKIKDLNHENLQYSMFMHPFILILDNASRESISTFKKSQVISAIHQAASDDEFLLRIEVVSHTFNSLQSMRYWAFHDMLTGLKNRRTFNDLLTIYFENYHKNKVTFSLAVLDLDDFKNINDKYGHQKGDEVLESISKIMQKNTRKTDILARIGGEEFAILFAETNILVAEKVLRRILKKVRAYKDQDGVKISFSAGLTEVHSEHASNDKVLSEADNLLYQVKYCGKDGICLPKKYM